MLLPTRWGRGTCGFSPSASGGETGSHSILTVPDPGLTVKSEAGGPARVEKLPVVVGADTESLGREVCWEAPDMAEGEVESIF